MTYQGRRGRFRCEIEIVGGACGPECRFKALAYWGTGLAIFTFNAIALGTVNTGRLR
jgi:hypothetical protein